MSWLMAFFTFLNAWWITLFITVPMCIETGPKEQQMEYDAAPKRIHWRKIIWLNSLIAAIATLILALVIESGIVQVR
ncbi:MAG: DUF1467 family protein [Rickettsiales bacterium]|jgi:predicted secreted protein|nr:DUF1467 family protein [Rickettsiales bacterium]